MTTSETPTTSRDLNWIKLALQSAVEVECSTLPLYLSALFSLEVQNYTTYNVIRSVAMEEMVHVAIAANMLAALGGKPQLKYLKLSYPMHGLPGGAEPDLRVGLAQLSRSQLKHFMRIEKPEFLLRPTLPNETYPTIAVFYEGIRQAIIRNEDTVRAAVKAALEAGGPPNQVGDIIGFKTITSSPEVDPVNQLLNGIEEIVHQGEGTTRESLFADAVSQNEESHYAKFAELYHGASYQDPHPPIELTSKTEREFFKGYPIAWPTVINTLAVPADGYARILKLDPAGKDVTEDLVAFDKEYSSILAALDAVWNGPADKWWPTLGGAVGSMMKLRVLCCFKIMRRQIPADIVAQLSDLYPDEIDYLNTYADLQKPVFYGPRFLNTNS